MVAAVLTPTLASAVLAQRRATVETGPLARRESIRPTKPQPTPTSRSQWSFYGGLASGDAAYDMGFALGGTGRWQESTWPVAFRGDGYFAHHSGDIGTPFGGFDVSLNMFGVMGSAEYSFPTQSRLKPYVFGGLGMFYSNQDIDYDDGLVSAGGSESSTDLGMGIGGGLHLTPKFGLEMRFMDVGGFSTIPILAVLHF